MIFLYFASDTFESRAKVLTDSIKKFHPNDNIVHVNPGDGSMGQYIPNLAKKRLEKALELMNDYQEDIIIIGADCELFAPLEISFDDKDVWIVPHVKAPLENRQYMAQIYDTGHANADFIALKNCENSKNILSWLISVTEDGKKTGAFYEQTWLSSIPFLFDNVGIIRHPGYNVGYWDVNHTTLCFREGNYEINGKPLVLFQYSGYVKGEPMKMSRHSQELCRHSLVYHIYKKYDDRIES